MWSLYRNGSWTRKVCDDCSCRSGGGVDRKFLDPDRDLAPVLNTARTDVWMERPGLGLVTLPQPRFFKCTKSNGRIMGMCTDCGEDSVERICEKCRQRLIKSLVPPTFHVFTPSRLPDSSIESYKRAMQWKMGPRGIIMLGATGIGKTRILWEVLKRVMDADTEIFCPGPHSFSNSLTRAYQRDEAESWLEHVSTCRLVAFDDITKLKMTERVESELFGVIDYRCCNELPVLVTAQSGLIDRMTEDRGAPLMRRLKEFCETI